MKTAFNGNRKTSLKVLIPLIILGLLAGLGYWIYQDGNKGAIRERAEVAGADPEFKGDKTFDFRECRMKVLLKTGNLKNVEQKENSIYADGLGGGSGEIFKCFSFNSEVKNETGDLKDLGELKSLKNLEIVEGKIEKINGKTCCMQTTFSVKNTFGRHSFSLNGYENFNENSIQKSLSDSGADMKIVLY